MLFTAMVLVVKPPVRRRLDFEHHIDVEEVNNDEEFQCGQRSPLMSLEGPLNGGRCSIGGWLTSRITEDTDVAGREEHHIDVEEVNNDEEFQCGQRSPLMSLEGPLNGGRCSIGGWLTSRVTEDTDVARRGFERRKMLNWWMVDVTGHRRYREDVAVARHAKTKRKLAMSYTLGLRLPRRDILRCRQIHMIQSKRRKWTC